MKFFKKKTSFIACVCPKCGGNLELDAQKETGFCKDCGVQCVMEEIYYKKHKDKRSKLETVISFVERQQSIHRQDKQEKEKKAEEEKIKKAEWSSKYWWIVPVIIIILLIVLVIGTYLEV